MLYDISILKRMKKISLFILAIMVSVSISSCKKDNASPKKEVVISIYIGTWKVHSYVKDGKDVTTDFDSYSFGIGENGTMMAYEQNETVTGSWHCHERAKVLHFQFDAGFPLSEISKSWKILEETSEAIQIECSEGQLVRTVTLVRS
jgi:hypothetical protein